MTITQRCSIKKIFLNISLPKIRRKTPVPESLFNENLGLTIFTAPQNFISVVKFFVHFLKVSQRKKEYKSNSEKVVLRALLGSCFRTEQ